MNKFLKSNTAYYLFTLAIVLGLTAPMLIQDGMFMDVVLYSSVAHNLGSGIGTFWYPQFSLDYVANLPSFHEQPPLIFGIQGLIFNIFGDSMYIERLYTLLVMLLEAYLIIKIWNLIVPQYKNGSWLPVLLWITIPVCFWSYQNNMLENSMTVFVLLSVYYLMQHLKSEKGKLIYIFFAAICIFLSTFSKGIPGFFPIVVPFFYWLFYKNGTFKSMVFTSFIITIIPIVIYIILFQLPFSSQSLHYYLFDRVFHRIDNDPTVSSHFYIIGRLAMELIPQILFVIVVYLISIIKVTIRIENNLIKMGLFFCIIGLCGSLPIMLTMVQKGFYFVPALPFFGIGLALLIIQLIDRFTTKLISNNQIRFRLNVISVFTLLFVISFSLSKIGSIKRDPDLINDVALIGSVVNKCDTIGISAASYYDWNFTTYLMRNQSIAVDCKQQYEFVVVSYDQPPPLNYELIHLHTYKYNLYKQIKL